MASAFPTPPVVETERLRLRSHRRDEFEAYLAMWQEEGVVRFTLGRPASREEAWTRFLRMAGHWTLQGFGWWAIEEKASGRLIGETGVFDYRRDMTPSLEGKLEMGWGLSDSASGKGFALEATRAVLAWARMHLPPQPIYCIIDPGNGRSIKLAEKLGFEEVAKSSYKDKDITVYRRKSEA